MIFRAKVLTLVSFSLGIIAVITAYLFRNEAGNDQMPNAPITRIETRVTQTPPLPTETKPLISNDKQFVLKEGVLKKLIQSGKSDDVDQVESWQFQSNIVIGESASERLLILTELSEYLSKSNSKDPLYPSLCKLAAKGLVQGHSGQGSKESEIATDILLTITDDEVKMIFAMELIRATKDGNSELVRDLLKNEKILNNIDASSLLKTEL
jgi:hypothetical protein